MSVKLTKLADFEEVDSKSFNDIIDTCPLPPANERHLKSWEGHDDSHWPLQEVVISLTHNNGNLYMIANNPVTSNIGLKCKILSKNRTITFVTNFVKGSFRAVDSIPYVEGMTVLSWEDNVGTISEYGDSHSRYTFSNQIANGFETNTIQLVYENSGNVWYVKAEKPVYKLLDFTIDIIVPEALTISGSILKNSQVSQRHYNELTEAPLAIMWVQPQPNYTDGKYNYIMATNVSIV